LAVNSFVATSIAINGNHGTQQELSVSMKNSKEIVPHEQESLT